jgi:hypothetical protein
LCVKEACRAWGFKGPTGTVKASASHTEGFVALARVHGLLHILERFIARHGVKPCTPLLPLA